MMLEKIYKGQKVTLPFFEKFVFLTGFLVQSGQNTYGKYLEHVF
jgi:hypothetical protein